MGLTVIGRRSETGLRHARLPAGFGEAVAGGVVVPVPDGVWVPGGGAEPTGGCEGPVPPPEVGVTGVGVPVPGSVVPPAGVGVPG
ncbi:MAG: hypothetical protein QOG59_1801, partial [Solirubrobacteraceae bacterium]|nr:hypothetical protein [Solirubrobacteraceae bacterium]